MSCRRRPSPSTSTRSRASSERSSPGRVKFEEGQGDSARAQIDCFADVESSAAGFRRRRFARRQSASCRRPSPLLDPNPPRCPLPADDVHQRHLVNHRRRPADEARRRSILDRSPTAVPLSDPARARRASRAEKFPRRLSAPSSRSPHCARSPQLGQVGGDHRRPCTVEQVRMRPGRPVSSTSAIMDRSGAMPVRGPRTNGSSFSAARAGRTNKPKTARQRVTRAPRPENPRVG